MGDGSASPSQPRAQLNLPPTMPRDSLALETLTPPSDHVNRMINSAHSQSPSRAIYSDRFIPSRSSSNFALFGIQSSPSPQSAGSSSSSSSSAADSKEEASPSTYNALLRAALFGPDTPERKESPMVGRNIFRYKTETKRSLHSLSPFGFEDAGNVVSQSPAKAARKVPRSPYKVRSFLDWFLKGPSYNSVWCD